MPGGYPVVTCIIMSVFKNGLRLLELQCARSVGQLEIDIQLICWSEDKMSIELPYNQLPVPPLSGDLILDHINSLNIKPPVDINKEPLIFEFNGAYKSLSWHTVTPDQFDQLTQRVQELETSVETLTQALNESREQIQALLDYCFADKSKWKEGQTQRP